MASKIKFEAEQHRKNRDSHNYIRMASDEEEWEKPHIRGVFCLWDDGEYILEMTDR